MAIFIKTTAVILFAALVVFSVVLGSTFKISEETGDIYQTTVLRYNDWIAIGGCILAIIMAAPLYLLGYALEVLQDIQYNTLKSAEANATCSVFLANVLGELKTAGGAQPAAPPTADAEPISAVQTFDPAVGAAQIDRSQVTVNCPACGLPQESDRSDCFRCGLKFVEGDEGQDEPQAPISV